MITTTWTISQLERRMADGTVFTAHWRASAQDGDLSASVYNTLQLKRDPSETAFIPYEQLTEAQVIAWVKAALGEAQVAAIETSLAAQIDAMKNPSTAAGLPWK